MIEEWKDIKGYEGLYQISNMGRVKSLARLDDRGHHVRERILINGYDGQKYLTVHLSKHNQVKTIHIHRLVAEAFIPNPDNKPTINHIDENKENNWVNNLEWMTYKENAHHGTRMERCYGHRDYERIGQKISQTLRKIGLVKHINQYDLNMNYIASYDSITDAAKANRMLVSGISNALRHYKNIRQYKGYIWEYADT